MYTAAANRTRTDRSKQYLVNSVLEATPEKLIMRIYDYAIGKCKQHDLENTNKAINELIAALSYDTEEIGKFRSGY